ncbi:MAG: hypothetical protein IT378_12070 [Sandaracinaceae bacterium]|nr:hypothetical protein [Sandaracinaceae bacterium]
MAFRNVLLWAALAAAAGCTGAPQAGSPCEISADCGPGLACLNRSCVAMPARDAALADAGSTVGCGVESCDDGLDNDCDGTIENGCACAPGTSAPCFRGPAAARRVGRCADGSMTCEGTSEFGTWGACTGDVLPQAEVCDAELVDEDCDGAVNEDCECADGEPPRPCGSSTGACRPGVQRCLEGRLGTCEGAVEPAAETCNAIDDDCDGEVDEGVTRACPAACGTGTETCEMGVFGACVAPPPSEETCNNLDDDCDDFIDEDLTRDCGSACGAGVETCRAGGWIGCTAPAPGTETCNGRDDDCDGLVDEDITRACTTACGPGLERCRDGAYGACTAPGAGPELCNNPDDDCDGLVDEDITRSCTTACGPGTETCAAGTYGPCTSPSATIEICNGRDDDCDGSIDEGLTRACSTAGGSGVETCSAGGWGGCTAPPTGTETCNGRDDNCNGAIDEGLASACSTACGSGVETCSAGGWSSCTAPAPSAEVCNGRDDDCDGAVDEGVPGVGVPCGSGVTCGFGTTQCNGASIVCVPGPRAADDPDGDGLGNAADPDDDNDGIPDAGDEFPQSLYVGEVNIGFEQPDIGAGAAIGNQWARFGVRFTPGFTVTALSTTDPCANAAPVSPQNVCTPLIASSGRCSGPAFGTAFVANFDPGTSYDYASINNRTSAHCRSGCGGCLTDGDLVTVTAFSPAGSASGQATPHNGSVPTNDAVGTARVRLDGMTRIEIQMTDSDGLDDLRLVDLRPPCP